MVNKSIGLLYLLFLFINLYFCGNDENLKHVIDLLTNSSTPCSVFFLDSITQTTPIYVHKKYPVITKIINEKSIFKELKEKTFVIDNFVNILVNYVTKLEKENVSKNSFKQSIQYILLSFQEIEFNIQIVGLCFQNQFYDSTNNPNEPYFCKNNFNFSNSKIQFINNKTYNIHLEPTYCSISNKSTKFPFTLIYSPNEMPILIYFQFDVTHINLNQCETKLHHCKEETTECIYRPFPNRQRFTTGNYYCQCRKGFFMGHNDGNSDGFPGYIVEREFLLYDENDPIKSEYIKYNCQPCQSECQTCTNNTPCKITTNSVYIRGVPLAFQSFCITLCIVTGIIVFQQRHTRVVKTSNWLLLELFLLGAISIYSMVINAYFIPKEITCAIQPFLKEGGFVLMYGVLYVKVYRVLCSFQSRKAQRVYVRDQDILRYLSVLVIICLGHLIAWVATSFDHQKDLSYTLFHEKQKVKIHSESLLSTSCRSKYWDIISYFYETGLLAITIYYCKCVKSAPSEYGEVRFITIAVINEFIISLLVIITRMSIINSVHPDYIFLIYFLHCHATTTISLGLLLGPKLWYLYRPPTLSTCRPRLVPHSETHIIQTQQKLNGDVDLVEINLAEMDSETIRDELKRLYTQLEIYKTRAMRKDNPHVSRKRGGRKQRRFSLQHFHKKHHTSSGHDDETSKISEDSGGNSGGEEVNLTAISTK